MQRKKIEAEERRLRQRKAKEEFMKMLEVSIKNLLYISPLLCDFEYVSFDNLTRVGLEQFFLHLQNIKLGSCFGFYHSI